MRRPFAAAAVLFCLALSLPARGGQPAAPAQPAKSNPKLEAVRKLLTIMGSTKVGQQVIEQMIPAMKQSIPHVPDRFWDDFRKEAKPEELFEQLVLIYDKHFTEPEIKEIIAFYETPGGKKLVTEMPLVNKEFVAAQQAWSQALAEKVSAKLGVSDGTHGK
jgi:hypothetical protein